ncbi:MAG: hypothetical protein ACI945_002319, partial [Pseudohongiellaceae bacterium]
HLLFKLYLSEGSKMTAAKELITGQLLVPQSMAKQLLGIVLLSACVQNTSQAQIDNFAWHAGDHHIHSRYSVGWDRTVEPPAPIKGGDAIYPTPMNALMAKYFGLSWMVTTDHGGPNHSKVNFELAYPELLQSRLVVPDLLQFYGMEFDTPGADHSSLIIPFTDDEATRLFEIESNFAKREPWPADPTWDSEPKMLLALQAMARLAVPPLLIANHPSRSATELGVYGLDSPTELRRWNNTAPNIAIGMAGAPGHQASTLNPDGSLNPEGVRGGYRRHPTYGGFDQFTAKVGGFWDSMIGEGRDWWITANSDSHVHYSEGGSDFWPGEYSKTFVWSENNYDSVMTGIRSGNVFVTTGDLIDELYITVSANELTSASIGDTIEAPLGKELNVTIRFQDPSSANFNGDNPEVTRVDLILGKITGTVSDLSTDTNSSTQVIARFTEAQWKQNGTYKEVSYRLPALDGDSYIRVRGTNSDELEPSPDQKGESPWTELWFYSNPIRIEIK